MVRSIDRRQRAKQSRVFPRITTHGPSVNPGLKNVDVPLVLVGLESIQVHTPRAGTSRTQDFRELPNPAI